jgi:hypothetical protein
LHWISLSIIFFFGRLYFFNLTIGCWSAQIFYVFMVYKGNIVIDT